MKPIDAYNDVSLRAKRLLQFHDGLINTRKKGIREDWKKSFCKLMHWAQSSQIERVDSREAIVILRKGAKLKTSDFTKEALDDLLRGALTFGISALDRYIHERVVKNIISALKKPNLNKKQEDFSVPAVSAVKITKSIAKAKTDNKNLRPANSIRNEIQELLHERPFQSWRELEYAFCLIGITNLGQQIQERRRSHDIKPIRHKLNKIVRRRNYIVHEGDLKRHQRGGLAKPQKIERKFVEESLKFLDDFVHDLENVAQA
jgi:hypothetical protein